MVHWFIGLFVCACCKRELRHVPSAGASAGAPPATCTGGTGSDEAVIGADVEVAGVTSTSSALGVVRLRVEGVVVVVVVGGHV